jgi:hypothetical protein
MNCPECDEECDRDSVDIDVGIQYGPWGCYGCGWSEIDRKRIEADNPGWYCDPTGGLHRIAAVVEKCERFGIGEAAREAFDGCGNPHEGGTDGTG